MAAAKVAIQRTHTGSYVADTAQRQAQVATVKTNAHVDTIAVLNNRVYVALATDTGNVAAAAYVTLLTASITTLLERGFLIITFSASGAQAGGAGTNFFQIVVDGTVVKGLYETVANTFSFNVAMVVRVAVVRGPHTIKLQWKTNVGTHNVNAKTTNEEHAHMLIQEAL